MVPSLWPFKLRVPFWMYRTEPPTRVVTVTSESRVRSPEIVTLLAKFWLELQVVPVAGAAASARDTMLKVLAALELPPARMLAASEATGSGTRAGSWVPDLPQPLLVPTASADAALRSCPWQVMSVF